LFSLLQRHIFFELLKTLALSLAGVSALVMLGGSAVQAAKAGLAPMQILKIMPYVIPETFPYTIPTCMLFACTIVYTNLSTTNQMVAIKAAGVNVLSTVKPALALGVLSTVAGIAMADRLIPHCYRSITEILMNDAENVVLGFLGANRSVDDPDRHFELTVHSVRNGRLFLPMLRQSNRDGSTLIEAREADLKVVDDPEMGKAIKLTFFDGLMQSSRESVRFKSQTAPLIPMPDKLDHSKKDRVESTSLDESRARAERLAGEADGVAIEWANRANELATVGGFDEVFADWKIRSLKLADAERDARQAVAKAHLRLAQASASLSFVLVGCPIALLVRRRDFLQAFFLSFLPIISLYYPFTILMFNVYKEGKVGASPAAIWLPTAVFLVVGVRLLNRSMRS
jgi:lipopolysaccharide export system permease protein